MTYSTLYQCIRRIRLILIIHFKWKKINQQNQTSIKTLSTRKYFLCLPKVVGLKKVTEERNFNSTYSRKVYCLLIWNSNTSINYKKSIYESWGCLWILALEYRKRSFSQLNEWWSKCYDETFLHIPNFKLLFGLCLQLPPKQQFVQLRFN